MGFRRFQAQPLVGPCWHWVSADKLSLQTSCQTAGLQAQQILLLVSATKFWGNLLSRHSNSNGRFVVEQSLIDKGSIFYLVLLSVSPSKLQHWWKKMFQDTQYCLKSRSIDKSICLISCLRQGILLAMPKEFLTVLLAKKISLNKTKTK